MIPYKKEDATRAWPTGEYAASIVNVSESVSKAGNPMLVVDFDSYRGAATMRLTDYIVFPTFTWKLKRLAAALGAMDAFNAESFDPAEYIGKSLTLTLRVEAAKGGFDERNSINAYGPPASGASSVEDEIFG